MIADKLLCPAPGFNMYVLFPQSVTVSPPNDAVSVDFRPTKMQPELLRQTTIAYVTFKGKEI